MCDISQICQTLADLVTTSTWISSIRKRLVQNPGGNDGHWPDALDQDLAVQLWKKGKVGLITDSGCHGEPRKQSFSSVAGTLTIPGCDPTFSAQAVSRILKSSFRNDFHSYTLFYGGNYWNITKTTASALLTWPGSLACQTKALQQTFSKTQMKLFNRWIWRLCQSYFPCHILFPSLQCWQAESL